MSFQIIGIRFRDTKDAVSLNDVSLDKTVDDICSSILIEPTHEGNEGDEGTYGVHEDASTDKDDESSTDDSASSVSSNCGEYDLYSKVETHMRMSISLYIVNRQGQDILKELEIKKVNHKRKTNQSRRLLYLDDDINTIYTYLHAIINFNRINHDLYAELLNVLDEELFNECGELESFYVKEDEYKLESMYYKQESWVNEIEWEIPQIFNFMNGEKLDTCECTHLLMYCQKYSTILDEIVSCFDNVQIDEIVEKMHEKLKTAIAKLQCLLCNFFSSDTTTFSALD